ncbi:MAG: hypothetical protein V8Q84_07715 [Bilophila sp.]
MLKQTTNINFVGMRRYAYGLSVLILVSGVVAIVWHGGLRYGVDFAGGVMVQVQFEKGVPDQELKTALAEINLPGLTVQRIGDGERDYMLRFSAVAEGSSEICGRTWTRCCPRSSPTIRRPSSVWRWWAPRWGPICATRRWKPCFIRSC